ncbi:NADH-quinone oxidoreductase subunit M [Myxococcota bacterium]|nr:NADH-quinone oxidoreductase subunit M [Myxococcota bacterium]MBU1430727.1 NADH-quinone oxidoreductase subunit M [Myxococcota bacterium]MBU1898099.1 NADH-quinone oxidoreductase subunit M [Myxococcota bacterium]
MNYQTNSYLLTWMIFTPAIGIGVILAALGLRARLNLAQRQIDQIARGVGFAATLMVGALSLVLWSRYDSGSSALQFVHHFVWMRSWNIEYFVGIDGLSVALVILTALTFIIAMIASVPWWGKIEDGHHPHFSKRRVSGYIILFLLLEMGVLGTFCAQDFFLFYVFWEVMLLPMYFLIGVWGAPPRVDEQGRVRGGPYAAIKFFLYTLAGSVLMLLAMIAVYYTSGPSTLVDGTKALHTFSIPALTQMAQAGLFAHAAPILGVDFVKIIFVALFLGFAVKVPMFPFHTWLPDAHVDAPTPISVILAGILLKTGGYGILRFDVQIFGGALAWAAGAIGALGVISILYGAFVCMAQKDLKKLIAYSSVSHMGFVLLGIAALTPQGMTGAMFQMISHGVVSAMLFLLVGVIYDRAHTRDIEGFGGLAAQMPEYTGLTGLAFMASLGLPGLAGFVGEILVFLGAFGAADTAFRGYVAVAALSVIVTAGYYLWTMHRMFLGELNKKWEGLWDMNWRERLALYPLAVLTIVLGFYPAPVFALVDTSLHSLLAALPRLVGG